MAMVSYHDSHLQVFQHVEQASNLTVSPTKHGKSSNVALQPIQTQEGLSMPRPQHSQDIGSFLSRYAPDENDAPILAAAHVRSTAQVPQSSPRSPNILCMNTCSAKALPKFPHGLKEEGDHETRNKDAL